jgi:hypothetical protein
LGIALIMTIVGYIAPCHVGINGNQFVLDTLFVIAFYHDNRWISPLVMIVNNHFIKLLRLRSPVVVTGLPLA